MQLPSPWLELGKEKGSWFVELLLYSEHWSVPGVCVCVCVCVCVISSRLSIDLKTFTCSPVLYIRI